MPKTTSAPSASSERTKIWAPVRVSSVRATFGAAGVGADGWAECALWALGARWASSSGVGLVIAVRTFSGPVGQEGSWARKNPACGVARGASASTAAVDALGDKYSARRHTPHSDASHALSQPVSASGLHWLTATRVHSGL